MCPKDAYSFSPVTVQTPFFAGRRRTRREGIEHVCIRGRKRASEMQFDTFLSSFRTTVRSHGLRDRATDSNV